MVTPVVHGNNREMWFADLTDAHPTYSFLEDAVGTSIGSGQVVRSQRLGDPINTGPNDTWHQLTWQGGAQQEIWADKQMYQKGNVDAVTWTGKAKMWPGFLSWFKKEHHPNGCNFIMCQGTRADVDWRLTAMYVGESTRGPWENLAPAYLLYFLHPGYGRGDARAHQLVAYSNEPYRFIQSGFNDNATQNSLLIATATHMYWMDETTQKLIEDTNAPVTTSSNFQYSNDTAVSYADGFYYAHGNRLFKRTPLAPYGVLGTHTKVKTIYPAKFLTGMTVWNNRIYFGAFFPSGVSSVYVSDGATTVKAFEFPHQFYIDKMVNVAGSLYILGMQPSGLGKELHQPNLLQQLWRYDGVSLKKLWQEGHFDDGAQHWASDLAVYEGMVVWGCQGTGTSGNQTGVQSNNFACLMFYDPVNDAIIPGPGLDVEASNTLDLNISGIQRWNSGLAVVFKDNTNYGSALNAPYMIASMRNEDNVRHDLRWPMSGDVHQFSSQMDAVAKHNNLYTSEYHGPDDVANTKKTWLSLRIRVKLTGPHSKLDIYAVTGIDGTSYKIQSALADDGSHTWQDVVIPIKNPSDGTYILSKKLQIRFDLYNDDNGNYDSTDQVWIDDMAVQYILAPTKVRQWQVRIPISDAQLRIDGSANPLSTAALMETRLQALFFNAKPFKFFSPTSTPGAPADNAFVEVTASGYHQNDARLESTDNVSRIGSIAFTLTENVTNQ